MSDAGTDSTEPVTKTSGSWREGVDMPLTIVAAGFLIVFVAVGVIFADPVRIGGAHIYAWIANNSGWLYALGTAFFVLFIAFMGFSKIGKVRLGPPGQHTRVPGVLLDRDDVRARRGHRPDLLRRRRAGHALRPAAPRWPAGAHPGGGIVGMQYSIVHWALHPWAFFECAGLAGPGGNCCAVVYGQLT